MERSLSSLVTLWPVVLGAVVTGWLIGEFNDGASLASGFIQAVVVDYLIRLLTL
jgi:hypothetical protein